MNDSGSTRWKLILAFATVYVVWGSTYLGIRYAIETIPPLLMAGTRFLFAGAILLAVSLVRGDLRPSRVHWRTAFVLGALLLLCGNGGVTIAEKTIASGMAALLVTSEPLWIVVLNWMRPGGRAPSPREVFGVTVGFAGVALLLAPQLQAIANGNLAGTSLVGSLLVLGSAAAWAAGSLYGIDAPAVADRPTANGMTMVAGGSLLLLAGLTSGEARQFDIHSISTTSAIAWAYLAVFGSLVGFSAYTYLMGHTTPAKASTYAFVNPVVAVLLGWSIAGEPLDGRSVAAIVVIVGAVMLLTLGQSASVPARHVARVSSRQSEHPVRPYLVGPQYADRIDSDRPASRKQHRG